jgi:hypothetical protein
VNKPDTAIAVARESNIQSEDSWISNGETITGDWHRAVGSAMGVDYVSDKPAHMKALLTSLGVDWNPSRHESRQDPLPQGDNLMKAAYEDLLDALRGPRSS